MTKTYNKTLRKEMKSFRQPNSPSVIIPASVKNKILHWMQLASPNECSGLGSIIWDRDAMAWRVLDAWLVEQENGQSDTEMEAEAIGSLEIDHIKEKREGELRWWWHSHVDMSVFWSSTDLEAIAQLGEHGHIISSVFNLKGEVLSSFYQNVPFPAWHEDIPTIFETEDAGINIRLDSVIESARKIGYELKNEAETKKKYEEMFADEFSPIIDEEVVTAWELEFKEKCRAKKHKVWSGYTPRTYNHTGSILDAEMSAEMDDYWGYDLSHLTDAELIEEFYETLDTYPSLNLAGLHSFYAELPLDRLKKIIESDPYLIIHFGIYSNEDVGT